MSGPADNVDVFRHRPVHEIAALPPDEPAVQRALADLRSAGLDLAEARILHGDEGARILDRTGGHHGPAARLVRLVQNLGYDENILAVYDEALRKGEALLTVPCPLAERYRVGERLLVHGGHGIVYFGAGSAETLTQP